MTGTRKNFLRKLEAVGHGFFYGALRAGGQTGAYALLWLVVCSYVLCSRKVHRQTAPYVTKRFPDHGRIGHWFDTLRIVHSFGRVLVDRAWLGMNRKARFEGMLEGSAELKDLVKQGRGLVLLTAHVGNWQTALAHLTDLAVPVNSLMQYEQEAVAKHYFDLRDEPCPFRIINSDGYLGGMVECTAALQRGELVTIMGDRLTKGPAAEVAFLGDSLRLPSAAYSLAASTGAPVAVLLAAKTGRRTYRLRVWDTFYPEYGSRDQRRDDLTVWTGRFATALEGYVREYPYQWYNFFDLWRQ